MVRIHQDMGKINPYSFSFLLEKLPYILFPPLPRRVTITFFLTSMYSPNPHVLKFCVEKESWPTLPFPCPICDDVLYINGRHSLTSSSEQVCHCAWFVVSKVSRVWGGCSTEAFVVSGFMSGMKGPIDRSVKYATRVHCELKESYTVLRRDIWASVCLYVSLSIYMSTSLF